MVFLSRGKPLFLNLVPDFGNSKVQTERGEGGREGREGREGGSEKEKEKERERERENMNMNMNKNMNMNMREKKLAWVYKDEHIVNVVVPTRTCIYICGRDLWGLFRSLA